MTPAELESTRARVNAVAALIQPQLLPHPGMAARNAHAHVWLGLKLVFGEEWRARTNPASVHAFLDWMSVNPNAEYDEYKGPREELAAEQRGELW